MVEQFVQDVGHDKVVETLLGVVQTEGLTGQVEEQEGDVALLLQDLSD